MATSIKTLNAPITLDFKLVFTSKSKPIVDLKQTVTIQQTQALTADSLSLIVENKFKEIIKRTNGNEWQHRFSWVASRKFPNLFKEMPPFAEDGGNDGWIPGYGIYCQCYGPFKPAGETKRINEFIKKMEEDSNKIMHSDWHSKEEVKTFCFVWNTQFDTRIDSRVLKHVNDTAVALMKKHGIKIDLITAETLALAFNTLSLEQQLEFIGCEWLTPYLDRIISK